MRLITAIIVTMGIIYGAYIFDKSICETKANAMDMPHRYGFEGCMVKAKSGWIDIKQYRIVD